MGEIEELLGEDCLDGIIYMSSSEARDRCRSLIYFRGAEGKNIIGARGWTLRFRVLFRRNSQSACLSAAAASNPGLFGCSPN